VEREAFNQKKVGKEQIPPPVGKPVESEFVSHQSYEEAKPKWKVADDEYRSMASRSTTFDNKATVKQHYSRKQY